MPGQRGHPERPAGGITLRLKQRGRRRRWRGGSGSLNTCSGRQTAVLNLLSGRKTAVLYLLSGRKTAEEDCMAL